MWRHGQLDVDLRQPNTDCATVRGFRVKLRVLTPIHLAMGGKIVTQFANDSDDMLLACIEGLKQQLATVRQNFLEPADEDDEADVNYRNPEHYLKAVYRLTAGFAIQNALYGRPEIYSDRVMSMFKKDQRLAFLWLPDHLTPLIDLIRTKFIAPTFAFRRPNHHEFAKRSFGDMVSLRECGKLVEFSLADGSDFEAMRSELYGGDLATIERLGFPTIVRLAMLTHFNALVESGWIMPFLGEGSEKLDDSFLVHAARHVINSNMTANGMAGTALVQALAGFTMGLSQGALVTKSMPEEIWSDIDPAKWCEAAGYFYEFGHTTGLVKIIPAIPADVGYDPTVMQFAAP